MYTKESDSMIHYSGLCLKDGFVTRFQVILWTLYNFYRNKCRIYKFVLVTKIIIARTLQGLKFNLLSL